MVRLQLHSVFVISHFTNLISFYVETGLALLNKMGGCEEMPGTCNNKTCRGYEVDIMYFSTGNSIPGRLYGGNPIVEYGNSGDR